MKKLSGFILLSAVVILGYSCGSKSGNEIKSDETDSVKMPIVADTIVLGTDTVITEKNISSVVTENNSSNTSSNAYIVVDKPNLKLYVIENSDTLFKGPICAGRVKGDKVGKDDRRTPEGEFRITNIHDAKDWLYHTDDGRWVPHVYGPWFLRLDAKGWQGIGIHGTNAPAQIGQRRSKGCIRMRNEDIVKVHDLAFVGMTVKVLPDVMKGGGQNSEVKGESRPVAKVDTLKIKEQEVEIPSEVNSENDKPEEVNPPQEDRGLKKTEIEPSSPDKPEPLVKEPV